MIIYVSNILFMYLTCPPACCSFLFFSSQHRHNAYCACVYFEAAWFCGTFCSNHWTTVLSSHCTRTLFSSKQSSEQSKLEFFLNQILCIAESPVQYNIITIFISNVPQLFCPPASMKRYPGTAAGTVVSAANTCLPLMSASSFVSAPSASLIKTTGKVNRLSPLYSNSTQAVSSPPCCQFIWLLIFPFAMKITQHSWTIQSCKSQHSFVNLWCKTTFWMRCISDCTKSQCGNLKCLLDKDAILIF